MKENEKPKPKVCRVGQIAQFLAGIMAIKTLSSEISLTNFKQNEMDELGICIKDECGHWCQLHPATSREDHSGGKEMIFDEGRKTNRHPRREGPGGSTGYWILDASGYCGLGGKHE